MSSINFIWKYIKGMRRKLLLTFVSVILSYLIVQGIFIFSFNFQQKEIQKAIDSIGGDLRIGLYKADSSYEHRNLSINILETYRSTINQDIVEWDGIFAYSDSLHGTEMLLVDNYLSEILTDEIISTEEVLLSKSYAVSENVSEGSGLSLLDMNFTVSYLDYDQFANFRDFTKSRLSYINKASDPDVKALLNIDVLRNSSFVSSTTFQFYYVVKYNFSFLNDYRPSIIQKTTFNYDSILSSDLDFFSNISSSTSINTRLSNDLSRIEELVQRELVLYFLYSFPILIVCLYFYSLTLRSTKKWWQQDLFQLWQKGFSRKQTFILLLKIFLIFDLISLLLFLAIFVAESSILGLLVTSEYWLLSAFYALLFVLTFLFQVREIYLICFPKTEKSSIVSSEQDGFQKVIKYTDQPPKVKVKSLIICGVFLIIGVILLNFDAIMLWLQNTFNVDSFALLFASFGDSRPEYIGFFFTIFGLVILLISSIFIVLILLRKFFQITNKILVERGRNKEENRISLKIFRRSIFNHKNVGFLAFFLFLSTSFTWIFVNSVLIEQQYGGGYWSTPDLAIDMDLLRHYGMDIDVESLAVKPEIDLFTAVYKFEGFLIENERVHEIEITVIDPLVLSHFLKKGLDTNLFEFHSSKNVFQTMLESPDSFIIDFESYTRYSLSLEDEVHIVPFVEGQSYVLDGTIYDVTRFDVTNPRNLLRRQVTIPLQAFEFDLNLTSADSVYFNFKDIDQISVFQETLYYDFGVPSNAIRISTTTTSTNLGNYLLFLESVSFLLIFLISIPLIIDIFTTSFQSLARLYSRGYSFNKIIKQISSHLILFWSNYSFFGGLSSISILVLLKWTIPTLFLGQYYPIHFEASSLILLASTYLFILLIPFVISTCMMYLPSYRNKILSQLILSNKEKQTG